MRIAVLSAAPSADTSERTRYFGALASFLRDAGHDVEFVDLRTEHREWTVEASAEFSIKLATQLSSREDFDVIEFDAWLHAPAFLDRPASLVARVFDLPDARQRSLYEAVSTSLRVADSVSAPSHGILSRLRDASLAPRKLSWTCRAFPDFVAVENRGSRDGERLHIACRHDDDASLQRFVSKLDGFDLPIRVLAHWDRSAREAPTGTCLHLVDAADEESGFAAADLLVDLRQHDVAPFAWIEAAAATRPMLVQHGLAANECFGPELATRISGMDATHIAWLVQELVRDDSKRSAVARDVRDALNGAAPRVDRARVLECYERTRASTFADARPRARAEVESISVTRENWFDLWWLADTARPASTVARDEAGTGMLAQVGLDEFRSVLAIATERWADQGDDWNTDEGRFLRALQREYFDRVERALHIGEDVATDSIRLPPIDHPLWEDVRAVRSFLTLEQDSAAVATWLDDTLDAAGLRDRILECTGLRRFLVSCLLSIQSTRWIEVLASVYRDEATRSATIAQDEAALDDFDGFAEDIAALGLHAPLLDRRVTLPGPRSTATSTPKVAVIIPSYNHERYIEDCLESVLGQSLGDIEVFVVDDGSKDETVERAQALADPRLDVSRNPENMGLGRGVARCLSRVTAPYVAILNSDDLFLSNRLEQCARVLDSDAQANVVATGFALIDDANRELHVEDSCYLDNGPKVHSWLGWYDGMVQSLDDRTSFDSLLRGNHLATSSNIVARTDWLRARIPSFEHLKYCLDWEVFMGAAIDASLRFLPDELLAYRFHGSNTVWFSGGGREGYIFEVNEVLYRALRQWSATRVRSSGETDIAALVRSLTALLAQGESEASILLLAEFLADADVGDLEDGAILDFVRTAAARRARNIALEGLDMDPWQLARHARDASRAGVRAHAADAYVWQTKAFATRAWQAEQTNAELWDANASTRTSIDRLEAQIEDVGRQLSDSHTVRAELQASLERAWSELECARSELECARSELERERSERERIDAQLRETQQQLSELEQELAIAKTQLAAAQDERRAILESVQGSPGDSLPARVAGLRARSFELQRSLLDAQQQPRQDEEGRIGRVAAKLPGARKLARLRMRVEDASERRTVRPPADPATPRLVVVHACHVAGETLAWEAAGLRKAGFSVPTIAVGPSAPSITDGVVDHVLRARSRPTPRDWAKLALDPSVAQSRLAEFPSAIPANVWALVQSLRRSRAQAVLTHGASAATFEAACAARILELPLTLRVLGVEVQNTTSWGELLRALSRAAHVVTDSEATSQRLRAMHEDVSQLATHACLPSCDLQELAQDEPRNAILTSGFDAYSLQESLLDWLAEDSTNHAHKLVLLVGGDERTPSLVERRVWFERALRERGLQSRVDFESSIETPKLAQRFQTARAALSASFDGPTQDPAWTSWASKCLHAGIPIVRSDGEDDAIEMLGRLPEATSRDSTRDEWQRRRGADSFEEAWTTPIRARIQGQEDGRTHADRQP